MRRPSRVFAVLALLARGTQAAAIEPETNATARLAQLEALVGHMAAGQQRRGDDAPTPTPVGERADVVILEGQQQQQAPQARRELAGCKCKEYRNGAVPGTSLCTKQESGRKICYPRHAHGCDAGHSPCGRDPTPQASPVPLLVEAEESSNKRSGRKKAKDVYLNAYLQLAVGAPSQLPSADAFVEALSSLTGLSKGRVTAVASWGAAPAAPAPATASTRAGRRLDAAPAATATLYATFALKNEHKRGALETKLQMAEELPEISGRSFRIAHLEISEASSHPLACSAHAEDLKAQSAALLNELVALKRQEVELLRAATTRASNPATCNCDAMRRLSDELGVANEMSRYRE